MNRVFDWTNYRMWRPKVLRCMNGCLNAAVLQYLKRNPPRYFVSDDLDWLNTGIRMAKGGSIDARSKLIANFSREFDFIRAFHGCRPESLDSYKQFGILPSDPARLDAEAIRLFGN